MIKRKNAESRSKPNAKPPPTGRMYGTRNSKDQPPRPATPTTRTRVDAARAVASVTPSAIYRTVPGPRERIVLKIPARMDRGVGGPPETTTSTETPENTGQNTP